ncbi:MAG TPA: molybdenum cofactor biosynthesis protein MoaE [Jiangellaceae bacterium]|jgi:molybdopterin synthase catalytic subunit|nr:molybdenum cofactor biosynthesis protein MoaE [Jiangellaceae bacterium]
MSTVRLLDVRDQPLSVDEVLAAVADPTAGGICVFVGTVRNADGGKAVSELDYTAHPTVTDIFRAVADEVSARNPVTAVAALHRVGELKVGDIAVVVAASAPHRGEAFDGCRQFIDKLKARLPIWKHQLFDDGEEEWVGSP